MTGGNEATAMPQDSPSTMVIRSLASVTLVAGEARGDAKLTPMNLGGAGSDADGVFLESSAVGDVVEARTANSVYHLRYLGGGWAEISGHPRYCPQPVRVRLNGSRWLDRSVRDSYVSAGMQLQFTDPSGKSVLTSPIESVKRLKRDQYSDE